MPLFQSAERDLDILHITPEDLQKHQTSTYSRLINIVSACTDRTPAPVVDNEALSPFGARLSEIYQRTSFSKLGLICCQNTEPNFVRSILDTKISDAEKKGPLVLIADEGEVVAVQKNIGEASILPISDRPDLNLFVDTITSSSAVIRPKNIKGIDPAETVVIQASEYDTFTPTRLSISLVNRIERQELAKTYQSDPFRKKGLSIDLDAIRSRVYELQSSAIEIDPSKDIA